MSKTLTVGLVIGASLASSVGSSINSVGDKLSQLQKKSEDLKVGAALGRSFVDLRAETLKVRQEYEKTGYKSKELEERLQQLQRATRQAGDEAKKYGIDLGGAAEQTKYLETMSAQAEGRIGRIQARQERASERSQMRSQLTGTIAVGAAMFAYPIKTAVGFQQAIAEVGAITRASAEDMKMLEENAREMGRTTQFTAFQAAGAQKYLGMAGFNTNQIITAMPGMMNLAAAGAMDLASAADIASNILTGFNMKQEEMGRVADILTLAANSSNTSVQQMGYAFKYVAPIANELGFSIEQSAAVISKLSDAGIQGEMAGTTMRGMLTSLVDPSEDAAELLDFLGVKTMNAAGELRALPDILRDMDTAMTKRNWGSGQKARVNQTIFGARAGTGASAIRDVVLSGDIDALTEKYNNAEGASAEAARRMNDTARGALLRLGSAAESVAITIGNVFLPPLADMANELAAVTTKISDFAEKNPKLIKLLVGAAAGFVGMKAASLVGRIGISHLMDGFSYLNGGLQMIRPSTIQATLGLLRMKDVGGVFTGLMGPLANFKRGFMKDVQAVGDGLKLLKNGALSVGSGIAAGFKSIASGAFSFGKALLGGIKSIGIALMANPVILVIGVIVALVAGAAYLIWKHWDTVKVYLLKFWEGVKSVWNSTVNAIGDAVTSVGGAVQSGWNATKSFFMSFWDGIKSAWTEAVTAVGDAVAGLGDTIMAPFKTAFGWIGEKIEWFENTWKGLKESLGMSSDPDSPGYRAGRDGNGRNNSTVGGNDSPNSSHAIGGRNARGHAIGGIFDTPHTAAFAEGGKEEAVIPLEDHAARARSIWVYSGQKLGMFSGSGTSGVSSQSSVYIAPGAINITASPGMDVNALASEVMRRIENAARQKQGRSFADAAFAR